MRSDVHQSGCPHSHRVRRHGVPDTSMLLMLHTGRRSMKGGLFGRPREHTHQPCKRLPKTLLSCARLHHLGAVVSRHSPEHMLSPRWSHCVGTHVQTSIESVRLIDRLLQIARRHAGEAYRTRSRALCTLCTDRASAASQGLNMALQIGLLHGLRRPFRKQPSLLYFDCDV